MDIRQKKESNKFVPQEYSGEILAEKDQILQVDHIKNDYKYLDATIFNLFQKIDITNQMQQKYFANQQNTMQPLIPSYFKYYLHSQLIIPFAGLSMVFLKLRKQLTLPKVGLILCASSFFNEFAKYKRCNELDKDLALQYEEHSNAYNDLLYNLMGVMTYQDILKQIFNIDLNLEQPSSLTNYDPNIVHDFAFNLY